MSDPLALIENLQRTDLNPIEEAEAMTVNDRDLTDDQARWHSSIMATIVRQASELTYLTLNDRK